MREERGQRVRRATHKNTAPSSWDAAARLKSDGRMLRECGGGAWMSRTAHAYVFFLDFYVFFLIFYGLFYLCYDSMLD